MRYPTDVTRWFAIAPLLMLLFGRAGLGCAGSQEQTTCGLYEGWKAYLRYREASAFALPLEQPGIGDAVEVDVAAVACARQRNGTVLCWEGEERWQIPTLDDAQSVAVGTFGACAIRKTGAVICWYHHEIAEHVKTARALRDLDWPMSGPLPLVTVPLPAAPDRVCVSRAELTAGDVAGYRQGETWACAYMPVAGTLCWEINASDRLEPDTRATSMHRHSTALPGTRSQDGQGRSCPPPWPTEEQEGASRALKAYDAGVAAILELELDEALRWLKIAQQEADFLELWAAAGIVFRALDDPEQVQKIRKRYLACGGDPRRFDQWQPSSWGPSTVEAVADLVAEPEECAFREHQRNPCDQPPADALPQTRFDSIAVGGDAHACAIDQAGQVWCWGDNDFGQLGDGTRQARSAPVKVRGLTDAVSIGVGLERTCAVRRSGRVACWGVGARPHSARARSETR